MQICFRKLRPDQDRGWGLDLRRTIKNTNNIVSYLFIYSGGNKYNITDYLEDKTEVFMEETTCWLKLLIYLSVNVFIVLEFRCEFHPEGVALWRGFFNEKYRLVLKFKIGQGMSGYSLNGSLYK